jgi:uncharacterized protein YegL
MRGRRIQAVNKRIRTLFDEIRGSNLRGRFDIAIVSFNGSVELTQDLAKVAGMNRPELRAGGLSGMANAIHFAIDLVEDRIKDYRDAEILYYKPWIVLITDGVSAYGVRELDEALGSVDHAGLSSYLLFFVVGIEGADKTKLDLFDLAPLRRGFAFPFTLTLEELNFDNLWNWEAQFEEDLYFPDDDDEVAPPRPGWVDI